MRYRRADTPGGTFFFTVNLADRTSRLFTEHIDLLRDSVRKVMSTHPFTIVARVVLPEHLHAIWILPAGERDYPLRWSLIKAGFPVAWRKRNLSAGPAGAGVNVASGSAATGSTRYAMRLIWRDTWITFTLTR
jgi:REP element-mobilizing transposase RayT